MALPRGPMPLGEYDMVAKLGAGSFAQVFRAVHRTKGTVRAVKAIQLERLSPKLLKGLEAEITILREVRHPNISEPALALAAIQHTSRATTLASLSGAQYVPPASSALPCCFPQSSLWTCAGPLAGCT